MGATNSADNLIAEDYPPFQLVSQANKCVGKWQFAKLLARLSTFQVGMMANYLRSKRESLQGNIGLSVAQLILQSRKGNSDQAISDLADMKQEQKSIFSSLSSKFHMLMLCLQIYLLFWAIFEYGEKIREGNTTTTVGFVALLLSFIIQITFFSIYLVKWRIYGSNQRKIKDLKKGATDKENTIIKLFALFDKPESEIFGLLGSQNIHQLQLLIQICQIKMPKDYIQQKRVKEFEDKLQIIIDDILLRRQIYYESCEPTIKQTLNRLKADIKESHLLSIGNLCISLFHFRIIQIDTFIRFIFSKVQAKASLNTDNAGILGVSYFLIGLSLVIFIIKMCKINDHFSEVQRLMSNLTTLRLLSIKKPEKKEYNVQIEQIEKIEEHEADEKNEENEENEENVKNEEEQKELMIGKFQKNKIKVKSVI